ncbi:MAG TPA: hypothetical protein VE871_03330 [Longimicrobium sp.]|nr:hypothetical protein [Longimicrobium sp.]
MKIKHWAMAAAACAFAAPLAAQNDINTVCGTVPAQARDECAIVAQAVDAAQPQLGILMAGGNPILGTASTGGVRLGLIPRVSFTGRVNVVAARLPDIRELEGGEAQEFAVPAPAVGANVSVGVTQGFSLAPMIGGFGAIDLLGSVSVLPLSLLDDFGDNAFSWGAGARVGLIRESFVTPGVSVSLMYRDLGDVTFGEVCEGTETPSPLAPADPNRRACASGGDFGEIDFGLSNWSGRAAVSKRLLGLGLTAGVGYDKFDTDANFAFGTPVVAGAREIYRFNDVAVDNDRWSAFLDASFTVLVASLVAEVGWMQGADAIQGFPSTSDFDPGQGTWFGSLGARLSL